MRNEEFGINFRKQKKGITLSLQKHARQGAPQPAGDGYLFDSRGCRRGATPHCTAYQGSSGLKYAYSTNRPR